VDDAGRIVKEVKVASEPEALLKVSHRAITTPKQPKLANKFRHDRMTQGARPMKPLMDSMPRPALRRAAENTPSGAAPDDVENVPVFDRAGLAPKI
jgi:hypothetical protein